MKVLPIRVAGADTVVGYAHIDDQGRCHAVLTDSAYRETFLREGFSAGIALHALPDSAIPQQCPECEQGKHPNCSGDTWDDHADQPAPCPCAALGHILGAH